ncbi:mannose-1-phosphate guanylyltransferase [Paramesorhizobium deserti]|uniref:Mannose-1-phosphate guanylyltransferase n=1 Tax=Paramesorhizobium deserti TaxID=1494590 RepID=A0A135HQE6_9HYPH|nr:AGE family epimerase/isomerase [Paramesorhizobium deserti]KXF75426.1 mannose-1-phosphate guanylyltransferase [Paramesorhizobium deserti]
MTDLVVSFIMSGGVGSRLWPLSREDFPKQFHDLSGQGSMLQKTVRRMRARRAGSAPAYLLASELHAARIGQDLAGIGLGGGRPIFEPVGRNTAAAVVLATEITSREHGDALVLVVPSDHEISTDRDFWDTVEAGVPAALDGRIVVFGIRPDKPETGFGYVETGPENDGVRDVVRFIEKPDEAAAKSYLQQGNFCWNAGIFLFRASVMREAFLTHAPEIWHGAVAALDQAVTDVSGTYLPYDLYAAVPSISVDYAIMEHIRNIGLVEARFRFHDLGSWQSLLDMRAQSGEHDGDGNVVVGDVVAIDCEHSYLRSEGRLISAVGLRDMAVVATEDATFVAPISESQHVRKIVEQLEKTGRLETKFTPAPDRMPVAGAYADRVHHWLFEETLPLWSTVGVDERHGGFFEVLSLTGLPIERIKRTRTMARQIYAFAVAKEMGWDGPARELIDHGIRFIKAHGRTERGGWVKTFNPDGSAADPTEDAYDQSFVLLALAHAHKAGHRDALPLATETFAFIDEYLADARCAGFLEEPADRDRPDCMRRSNPHMHLLETFLAWHSVTGERGFLERAARIVDLFRCRFFDPDSWTLGEFFTQTWERMPGEKGEWTEPGHHFEWASLLVAFAAASGQKDVVRLGRKLYASAIANGLNRATGLAYNSVSRHGLPIDRNSRSWPQTEAIKAAIALDGNGGPDLKPEIEARVGRLFRWHIEPAPKGLWIDLIDEEGRARANDVPASIFYHLVCALTQYMDFARKV